MVKKYKYGLYLYIKNSFNFLIEVTNYRLKSVVAGLASRMDSSWSLVVILCPALYNP